VYEVRMENRKPRLANPSETTVKSTKEKKSGSKKTILNRNCPKCNQGKLLKGKTCYGCSKWNQGCDFRLPFKYMNKKLTESQAIRLLEKKATTKITGFELNGKKVEGILKLNVALEIEFENKTPLAKKESKMPACPKCKTGTLIKGKTAYGCSRWKEGCDFRFTFEDIKLKANGKPLTKELVLDIIAV